MIIAKVEVSFIFHFFFLRDQQTCCSRASHIFLYRLDIKILGAYYCYSMRAREHAEYQFLGNKQTNSSNNRMESKACVSTHDPVCDDEISVIVISAMHFCAFSSYTVSNDNKNI